MHQTRPRGPSVNLGLSTPNAGHGIKAHLVAGPSTHRHNSSNASGGSSNSSSSKQSSHPTFQSTYPTQTARPSSHPFSPPQHLRADPMRGAAVSCITPPGSHQMLAGSTSTPTGHVATRKPASAATPLDYSDSQIKPDKPAAPLPLRKQRTTSPPIANSEQYYSGHQHRLPYHPTGQHRCSQPSNAQEAKIRTMWPSQRQEGMEYAYAYGDSSNSSYMSNRNSGGSSDLTTPSSPHRSPRSIEHGDSSRTSTAASGAQTTQLYNPYHGYVRQATVVQAPANGPANSVGVTETVSSGSGTGMVASKNHPSYPNQPPPRNSPDRFTGPSDTGSEMTVSELRSIAERQRQQLSRQAHQIQSRVERLAYLRATNSSGQGSDKVPSAGSELTPEQEMRLQKLRSYRGQTERARLTNDNLVKEIDSFARLLSSNEVELDACRRRKEEAQRILSLISHCLTCIANIPAHHKLSTSKTKESASVEMERPIDLLSFQLPFASDRDKKRWRDGLMEADYLDRQISLALSHSSASTRRPTSPNSTEYDNSRIPGSRSCKSSTTIPVSCGSHGMKASVGQSNTDVGSTGASSHQTATSSGFSSLLSRASSPPTSRRSSLRMLLQATNSTGTYTPNNKNTDTTSQTGVTFSFPRLKAPPRYASRAVINETYMRRIRRDRVENYKRTANEIYRANVDRMASKQQVNKTESSTPEECDTSADNLMRKNVQGNQNHLVTRQDSDSGPQPSPLDSVSSSSSSSLELVDIRSAGLDAIKTQKVDIPPSDEEGKHSLGELDSGLGGSDDTGPSERTQMAGSNELTNAADRPTETVVFVVEDAQGLERSQTTTSPMSDVKSILRKSSKSQSGQVAKAGDSGADVISDTTPSSNSSQSRSNSVRFHPLALLLDAALEGDIELVKKAASQVSDVSEPNDEGITALHNAVCAGRMDIADFLVRTAGADVNAGDTDGWTPLHCAASCANLPLARLLVEHGASLHARTLSDQETPLEKCDQGDDEAECEEYLYFQQEQLGAAASGRVYALFPRGLESAGPGSADAHLEPDELAVWPNEPLTIIDRHPQGETEWMLAEKGDGTRGLIPRSHISCYPLVRVPPASLPIPLRTPRPRRFEWWDDEDDDADVDGIDDNPDPAEHNVDAQEGEDDEEELTVPVDKVEDLREEQNSSVVVEVDVSQRETPDVNLVVEPVSNIIPSSDSSQPKPGSTTSRLDIGLMERPKQITDSSEKAAEARDLKTAL